MGIPAGDFQIWQYIKREGEMASVFMCSSQYTLDSPSAGIS